MVAGMFEVIVRGRLGPDIVAALDGYTVETDEHGLTSVLGPVIDQAELLGLLRMFDDLHVEVVRVNPVDVDE